MMRSIRSSGGRPARSPRFRWGEVRWLGAVRWALIFSSVIVTLSWIAPPAEADEIEPDSAYEPEPAAEPEPERAPEPDYSPPPEAAHEPVEPSWIPSIETGVEVFDYNVESTLVNLKNSPAWDGNQSEAERQTMFRIGGELMGPMFESLPGRPRLFVKGGAHFRLWSSDDVFGFLDPAVPQEPEESLGKYERVGPPTKPIPVSFLGQGSEITARIQDPSWYAGLGVAFSVPIGTDRLLYLKPSIQYSMEKIDLRGALTTVDEPVPRVDPDPCGGRINPPCIREFFIHRSNEEADTTDHSVGLGLEVAVVPFRNVRPIRVSLYAEARFLWMVSGTTTRFADSDGVATYSVTRDDFNIKGGGGLRFSWVGFD